MFVIPVAPMGVPFGERKVLAEGKTDVQGRYHFDNVKLSVLEFAPQAVPRPSEAQFQVFALADGYGGNTWRKTVLAEIQDEASTSVSSFRSLSGNGSKSRCGAQPAK